METGSHRQDLIGAIAALAGPVARERGLELFEVEFSPGGRTLRVFIDRPDGAVTVADCSAVSRGLSELMDAADLIPHAYQLEVSSPGLDRPLRREDDYRRFAGRLARLVLTEETGGAADLRGRIRELHQGMVKLELSGTESVWVPLAQVKKARLEPELDSGSQPGKKRAQRKR